MTRTEMQKMLAGEFYLASDPEIVAAEMATYEWLTRYNAALAVPHAERLALLRERFKTVGDGVVVRPPFHCDYGFNISLGEGVFINYGCIILDGTAVTIGAKTLIAPGVRILTADHPRDAETRRSGLEFARAVTIGANVWIGANALILPGLTVGDDAVIGAGSVVTRDVPAGATVVGNPARVR